MTSLTITPRTANGIMPNYSFINGMLLDTQSGQIAFPSPNGLTDTTTDWSRFSFNNVGSTPTIDANALTGLNLTAPRGAPPSELAYPAKVTLLQDWIAVGGRHEPIRAGMRVSAEIKTGDRRVIEYLLSPVMQAVKEAGGER